jgi:predicted amidohydrolase
MREDKFLKGGEELVSMKLEGFQISPTICYDLRFPEMYRKLALSGTDIFLIPAEWPKPRCSVLHTLAQSRAIENQAILVLSNRVGKDSSKVEYCGGSGIFLPDGTFLEGNRVHKIDFKEVLKNRKFIQPLTERVEGVDF